MLKTAPVMALAAAAALAGLVCFAVVWTSRSRVLGDVDARLGDLESRLDRLAAALERLEGQAAAGDRGGARAGGSRARPDEREAGEERASEIDAAGLEDSLAGLESRLETLEDRVRGLEADPVSRGFAYVSSKDAGLRRRGVRALERVARSDPEALDAIRSLLEDPDPRVRDEAIEAVQNVKDFESLPRVLGHLADSDPRVREEAADTLGKMLGSLDAADPDLLVRRRAAVPALVRALADTERQVRTRAISALADLRDPAAVPPLRSLYDAGPGEHSLDLAIALKRLGDQEPFRIEADRLSRLATASENESERRDAVRILGRHDGKDYRELFLAALDDPSLRVRREAEAALRNLEGKP